MEINWVELTVLVAITALIRFALISSSTSEEPLSYDELREFVIEQAQDAYVKGKIDLERLELDVENLLDNKTPIRKDGMPVYYDPRVLDR